MNDDRSVGYCVHHVRLRTEPCAECERINAEERVWAATRMSAPTPVTLKGLAALLGWARDIVDDHDSMEGHITWEANLGDNFKEYPFMVHAAIRYGNREGGQGFIRMVHAD